MCEYNINTVTLGFLSLLRSCGLEPSPPSLCLGRAVAQDKNALHKLGVTHVLNAAHSKQGSKGNQSFYGSSFVYCGIPADDSSHFDLDVYFQPAADFIHQALKSPNGTERTPATCGVTFPRGWREQKKELTTEEKMCTCIILHLKKSPFEVSPFQCQRSSSTWSRV